MGIVNPRPAIRKAGIRKTEAKLKEHARRMAEFEAQGIDRTTASRRAYEDMQK